MRLRQTGEPRAKRRAEILVKKTRIQCCRKRSYSEVQSFEQTPTLSALNISTSNRRS